MSTGTITFGVAFGLAVHAPGLQPRLSSENSSQNWHRGGGMLKADVLRGRERGRHSRSQYWGREARCSSWSSLSWAEPSRVPVSRLSGKLPKLTVYISCYPESGWFVFFSFVLLVFPFCPILSVPACPIYVYFLAETNGKTVNQSIGVASVGIWKSWRLELPEQRSWVEYWEEHVGEKEMWLSLL